jgi:hypothetical protein
VCPLSRVAELAVDLAAGVGPVVAPPLAVSRAVAVGSRPALDVAADAGTAVAGTGVLGASPDLADVAEGA